VSADLSTRYLGFTLSSPIVASPSPLTEDPDMWPVLEEAGVGAIVLPSLFEEEVEQEEWWVSNSLDMGTDVFGEATTYLPEFDDYHLGPDRFLRLVERAKASVSVPVFASVNGTSTGGWTDYARRLVDAGADALELNVYDVVSDPRVSGVDVERRYLDLVAEVRASVDVPLAVKVGPWFSAFAHMACQLQKAGADGLVLFNRLYQPDIDLDTLHVVPRLHLSGPAEVKLPLSWVGVLHGAFDGSLAASTGVHSGHDALKLLLAGADVAMTTAALLRHGPEHVRQMLDEIQEWMDERGYDGVEQLKGSVSMRNAADPQAYQRANYYQVLHSWSASWMG
jgi:dihydroorotate dehydrogenase (fumarate)